MKGFETYGKRDGKVFNHTFTFTSRSEISVSHCYEYILILFLYGILSESYSTKYCSWVHDCSSFDLETFHLRYLLNSILPLAHSILNSEPWLSDFILHHMESPISKFTFFQKDMSWLVCLYTLTNLKTLCSFREYDLVYWKRQRI